MKVELSADELKQLDCAKKNNLLRKWFAHKDKMKFEIGDVLVKYFLSRDYDTKQDKWVVENINSKNKMVQRYVYIHEDEFGIGYIKQLRVSDGTLGKELICLTDYNYDNCKFEVDPEFAETTFLGAEFDIKAVHKATLANRKIVTKMNRKIGTKPNSVKQFNSFLEKVGVGGVFYSTYDYTGRHEKEYKIIKLEKVTTLQLERGQEWLWNRLKEKKDILVDDTFIYKVETTGGYYTGRGYYFIENFKGNVLYIQKPVQEEKK